MSCDVRALNPSNEVCDFCSAQPVVAIYPCRDFSLRAIDFDFNSLGEWAACSECHKLIERGDRSTLALRSALTHPDRGQIPAATLTRRLRHLHDMFWSNRLGPAVRA